ncbi:P-loop containing nucleoside triphosphate hydrolase protein [Lojkania enalia]|uniref:P-loop containing nucleoside triphosphate hydrolase protein n=1 Tax=Lojkania enalia TaxID=147567 RepID=A0A9P4MYZ6_9PLEO|nr:P-loop containing nucleoside triphosphate hydrolase protein [Didymosphaeria enalia]
MNAEISTRGIAGQFKSDTPDGNYENSPAAQKSQSNGRVKFRVEYVETSTGTVIHSSETKGLSYEDESLRWNEQVVFEIVTTIRTDQKSKPEGFEFKHPAAANISSVSMQILSGSVIHALRSVVKYYPGQDLSSDIVKIPAPYAILVHHYDELMEYATRLKPDDHKEFCCREKDAYEHICVLKAFLDEQIMPVVEEERARNERGYSTFDMLWVAFKPGTPIQGARAEDDEPYAGIMHSITGGSFQIPAVSWTFNYWTLAYDGSLVDRTRGYSTLGKFIGEEKRTIFPVDLKKSPREEGVEKLIAQGKLYWSLLRKQCRYFRGRTQQFPHNEVDGLVMVDMDAYYEAFPQSRPMHMDSTVDTRTWISDCTCSVCNQRQDAKLNNPETVLFEDYQDLAPKVRDDLEEDQYLLLPGRIYAFVFGTRTWELLDVNGFSEPKFEENMIDNLVMDEKRVSILKALAKSFIRINSLGEKSEREPWSADFVKRKGNGLIFLLHGKLGVGKTCTAECIAAFTSRPLMVVTSSDIGTNPLYVEKNLTTHFKRARSWGAVVLIDEADVFMERRSTADLARNSLVAGKPSHLVIGSFDDAFISRIHVQLYYPDFDEDSRRKVWQTFIDKLQHERGDYLRLNIDAKEYLEGKELKAVKWNGREIRNAFQTAVALAEYDALKDQEGKIILTDKHLKSVVEMSRDFKDYLKDLHRGDEGKRAERRMERLDK